MSGVKGRSGRRPKAWQNYSTHLKVSNEELADLEANRMLRYISALPDGKDRLEYGVKIVLPIYLKTMTSKQAIVQTSISLSLDQDQVTQLIELAQRNSLIYKDLDDK